MEYLQEEEVDRTPPIRQLFISIVVIFLMVYGAILFVGSYETGNGLPLNSTIANNYNAILGNSSKPGAFFENITGISNTVYQSSKNVSNTGASSIGALINSISLVVGFMTSLPQIYGALINFIAIPIAALTGLSVGFAQIIANLIILGVAALAIISAIFLYPIIAYQEITTTKKVK